MILIIDPYPKIRTEVYPGYPRRFPVPVALSSWSVAWPAYAPPYWVDPVAIANDRTMKMNGLADPETITDAMRRVWVKDGALLDANGFPLTPMGRTGIRGRGVLFNWWKNYAVDPIVSRARPDKPSITQFIVIERDDNGGWALPGGMVDPGELATAALKRELGEEAVKNHFDFSRARILLNEEPVDDRRTTDNSLIVSTVAHIHLSPSEAEHIVLRAGSDARKVKWMDAVPENINALYASHGRFVTMALG